MSGSKVFLSKSNLYGRLLVLVLLMIVTIILTSESEYLFGGGERAYQIGGFIYSVFMAGFIFFTVPMLAQLGYSVKVTKTVRILAFVSLAGSLYVSNPLLDVTSEVMRPYIFSFFHLTLLSGEILLARVILKDIFGNKSTQTDHIWGAIVVFYLIVMVFSETFELIALFNPGILGRVYLMGFPNYIQIMMFSLNSITGMDSLFPDAHPLLLKFGNLENMIGNLFLVVILGRLLSHPLDKS